MPIGIYDSGIGGLTVYKAIASKFKNLDMIYLGDSARVPYGNKSPETIIKYSLECSKYLAKRYNISALIVACNTISSHALEILHNELNIPVLGVILPGAKNAVDITKNNKIGVLATHATVNSKSYINAIKLINPNSQVYQQACPLFVPLVEEAFVDGEMVETVVKESLKDIVEAMKINLGLKKGTLIKKFTFFIAAIEKRIPPSSTKNTSLLLFTSGGRIFMPVSAQ